MWGRGEAETQGCEVAGRSSMGEAQGKGEVGGGGLRQGVQRWQGSRQQLRFWP